MKVRCCLYKKESLCPKLHRLVFHLPSGFQRDLQRVKPPLFRAIDLTIESIDIMAYTVSTVRFLPENIQLGDELFATEEAYKLVRTEGIPFREAYRRIGGRYRPTED